MGEFDQFNINHVSIEHNDHINIISKLASMKMFGQYQTLIKEPLLQKYYRITKNLMGEFDQFNINHLSREQSH